MEGRLRASEAALLHKEKVISALFFFFSLAHNNWLSPLFLREWDTI